MFVLEVQPGAKQRWFKKRLGWVHTALLKSGEVADANVAAAQAIQMILMEPAKASHLALESATGSSEAVRGKNDDEVEFLLRKLEEEDALYTNEDAEQEPVRFLAVLSLAEGETLRRVLHTEATQEVMSKAGVGVALRTLDGGFMLDASYNFRGVREGSSGETSLSAALQCLRFVNCDMYYTDEELDLLLLGLKNAPIPDREPSSVLVSACGGVSGECGAIHLSRVSSRRSRNGTCYM